MRRIVHFAIRRGPKWEYVQVTDGWGCGPGHVLANRMAYNRSADTLANLCFLDLCTEPNQYASGRCNSASFSAVPGVTKPPAIKYEVEQLLPLDLGKSDYEESGGVSTLLSLGKDGFLALAAGPGVPSAPAKPDTLGLLAIPGTIAALRETSRTVQVPKFEGGAQMGTQEVKRHQWNWLYLPDPDPALGREKRFGMAAMAYFDMRGEESERLLVGWSPSIAFQAITPEYLVSEIDRKGQLRGSPVRVKSAGWGEDNLWTTMPNSGCVVFPFAWVGAAPGGDYPIPDSDPSKFPTTLHMTSLCPTDATQPTLAPAPAPKTDEERWPPAP